MSKARRASDWWTGRNGEDGDAIYRRASHHRVGDDTIAGFLAECEELHMRWQTAIFGEVVA